MNFLELFHTKKPVIACIHLQPLPGAPLYGGNMRSIIDTALKEAEIYRAQGVDGLIVENFRDMPFYPDKLPAETVSAMSVVVNEVIKIFDKPVGVNALRNDAHAALAIAVATGATFIRVNIHTGTAVTDQGIIQGKAHETLRLKKALMSDAAIITDVNVKHATPLGKRPISLETKDLTERGLSDGIIVSGELTGKTADISDIEEVKKNTHLPVILGSGATTGNLLQFLPLVDALIVGSYFKKNGIASNEVSPERVEKFMNLVFENRK